MNQRILFMIVNDQLQYLTNSDMDHKEWYLSLGLPEDDFNNIIRGFILDGKMCFYKGENYNYDDDVMKKAKKYGPLIRNFFQSPNLEVCCGILQNGLGGKWEPIVKIPEEELDGYISPEEKEKLEKKAAKEQEATEVEPLFSFQNNFNDDVFAKDIYKTSIIVLIISIVIKILAMIDSMSIANNFLDFVFSIIPIFLLGVCVYGYKDKSPNTKYFGIAASVSLIVTFNFLNILLGIYYFFYTIDKKSVDKFFGFIKKQIHNFMYKNKDNNQNNQNVEDSNNNDLNNNNNNQ